MPFNLRIGVLIVAIILSIVIIQVLKKGRVPVKYSLLWWISICLLVIVAVFPGLLYIIANIMGFETMSNLVIGVFIIILIFITMSLTIIVSGQKRSIVLLTQEISMLKSKIENNE